MKKRNNTPNLWQDLGALAGLYQGILTLTTRRIKYGPDWPRANADDTAPPSRFEPVERRELIGAGRHH